MFDSILIESNGRKDLEIFLSNYINREGLYKFRINPESLDVKKAKLSSTVLTQAGHERAYFGNDLTRLSYRGSTGRMWLPQEFINSYYFDIRLSPVYQKFEQFKVWYESLNRDIMLLDHHGTLYKGICSDFSYNENASDPWKITYSFTFEAYTDKMYGERLGKAIKRLGKEDYLSGNYIASLAFAALTKAIGPIKLGE